MKMNALFILFILNLVLLGCNEQGRSGYKKIQDYARTPSQNPSESCTRYTQLEVEVCYDECPINTKIATYSEVMQLINEYAKTSPKSEETRIELLKIYENAQGICVDDIKRPTNEMVIKNDYCACDGNKEFIINNCSNFCSTRNDQTPTLFGSVTISDKIKNDPLLGNLYNWCTVEIQDGHYAPSCLAEVSNEVEKIYLEVSLFPNTNSFRIDLSFMESDKTYTLKIIETTSKAQTSSIQLRMKNPTTPVATPLQRNTISQYTCITASGYTYNNQSYYEYSAKLHYYFASNEPPLPLPPGNDFLYCHDKTLGRWDQSTYPRLELINNSFMLWNKKDVRFYDQNHDGRLDINQEIENRLTYPSSINLFNPFSFTVAPGTSEKLLGFYLQSFIDPVNQIPYCPTTTHFNSNSEIFQILKDYIGDTEAIYRALGETSLLKNNNGELVKAPDDYIFIRESELKKIWFYTLNSSLIKHTETTSRNLPIMFYYPIDIAYPLVKKPHQKIYTVIGLEELNSDAPRTNIQPADKRLGCVPQIN